MASTKYIGYVGGVAVAAGVGAALAVAGQGTAHADSTDGAPKKSTSSTSQHVNAEGATPSGPSPCPRSRTVSRTASTSRPTRSRKRRHTSPRPFRPPGLPNRFRSRPSRSPAPRSSRPTRSPSSRICSIPSRPRRPSLRPWWRTSRRPDPSRSRRARPWPPRRSARCRPRPIPRRMARRGIPNPFRADDPDPKDFPEAIMDLRKALIDASPDQLDPFVREATEQIYRGSQIVPWVNAVIPISEDPAQPCPGAGR